MNELNEFNSKNNEENQTHLDTIFWPPSWSYAALHGPKGLP